MQSTTIRNAAIESRTWRLTAPRIIEEFTIDRGISENRVIVRPTLASICHADLRYYTGQRRPEALAQKLPMALIHEGIGIIEESYNTAVGEGNKVVIVPNIPGYVLRGIDPDECCDACKIGIGENYCYNSAFLGSGYDGIAQSKLVLPSQCVIPIPAEVPDEIAVLTELCTVSYQALKCVKDVLNRAKVAVFGDGPVGYLTASLLHHIYGLQEDRLTVFGAAEEKLSKFTFARREQIQNYDFTVGRQFDVAIECTGGNFSESAANQAIDLLNRGGHLILMGVTEARVPINSRDVLEKGLTLHGSSRSSISDYHCVIEAMKDPSYQSTLHKLLPTGKKKVSTAEQFAQEMELAAAHRTWEKVILEFQW